MARGFPIITHGQFFSPVHLKAGRVSAADALYSFSGEDPSTVSGFLEILDGYIGGKLESQLAWEEGGNIADVLVAHRSAQNPDDYWAEEAKERGKAASPGARASRKDPMPKGVAGVPICAQIKLVLPGGGTQAILSQPGDITQIPDLYSFLRDALEDESVRGAMRAGQTLNLLVWPSGFTYPSMKGWSPRTACGGLDIRALERFHP